MVATLQDIRNKVRRITGRPSSSQISDTEIDTYINTYYQYDMPAQLKMESFRVNYQFLTQPNVSVYDFPTNLYLEAMPPVYVGGYQCIMSQSRDGFYKFNPRIMFMENSVATGNGTPGPYTGTLSSTPFLRGYYQNRLSTSLSTSPPMSDMNWALMFSATNTSTGTAITLIDDGFGFLYDIGDTYDPTGMGANARGTINYLTGAFDIGTLPLLGFDTNIDINAPINAQYVPYVASRPQSVLFYQDQIMLSPVPDQAYTVSFEAFQKPTAMVGALATTQTPMVDDLWQLLAYGAADKIFADNADMENMMKFRPLLEEQLKLCLRRTICQYSNERVTTIFTEQTGLLQNFNNLYGGI